MKLSVRKGSVTFMEGVSKAVSTLEQSVTFLTQERLQAIELCTLRFLKIMTS